MWYMYFLISLTLKFIFSVFFTKYGLAHWCRKVFNYHTVILPFVKLWNVSCFEAAFSNNQRSIDEWIIRQGALGISSDLRTIHDLRHDFLSRARACMCVCVCTEPEAVEQFTSSTVWRDENGEDLSLWGTPKFLPQIPFKLLHRRGPLFIELYSSRLIYHRCVSVRAPKCARGTTYSCYAVTLESERKGKNMCVNYNESNTISNPIYQSFLILGSSRLPR